MRAVLPEDGQLHRPARKRPHTRREKAKTTLNYQRDMKELKQGFRNALTYAAGMEEWVNKFYPLGPLSHTFAADFSVAEWVAGADGVESTYRTVKREWLHDYKAFTEVVVALNCLSFAHSRLKGQGFSGRDEFVELYGELWERAAADFRSKYEGNAEAMEYFDQMTD